MNFRVNKIMQYDLILQPIVEKDNKCPLAVKTARIFPNRTYISYQLYLLLYGEPHMLHSYPSSGRLP